MFLCHSLSVAGVVFQACSFTHSDISPVEWNQQFTVIRFGRARRFLQVSAVEHHERSGHARDGHPSEHEDVIRGDPLHDDLLRLEVGEE